MKFVYGGELYGFVAVGNDSGYFVNLDFTDASYTKICSQVSKDLNGNLFGSSNSVDQKYDEIIFYQQETDTPPLLWYFNTNNCTLTSKQVSGLSEFQHTISDIKYDSTIGSYFIVFPNPNCIHGSFESVNINNATALKNLADVVDGDGLFYQSGIDIVEQKYIYITFEYDGPKVCEIKSPSFAMIIALLDLTTGNVTAVPLQNNELGIGIVNYTMVVYNPPNGSEAILVGAATQNSDNVTECYPSGFFNIDITSGNVKCIGGKTTLQTVMLNEIAQDLGLLFQVFVELNTENYYLYTWDIINQKLLYQTPCSICGNLTALAYVM